MAENNSVKNTMSQLKAMLNLHPNLMDILLLLFLILLVAKEIPKSTRKQRYDAVKGKSYEELFDIIVKEINEGEGDDVEVERTDVHIYTMPAAVEINVLNYKNVKQNGDEDFISRNFEGEDAEAAKYLLGTDCETKHDPMRRV